MLSMALKMINFAPEDVAAKSSAFRNFADQTGLEGSPAFVIVPVDGGFKAVVCGLPETLDVEALDFIEKWSITNGDQLKEFIMGLKSLLSEGGE